MEMTSDIYITDKCDMKCTYCYHKNYGRHTITLSNIKKAIDYLLKYKCESISFLGGEPLLEENILKEAIKYIRKKNKKIKIFLYTNGNHIKSSINFFNRNNVNVFLSLDGDFKTFTKNRNLIHINNFHQKKIIYKKILQAGKKIKNNFIMMYINNSPALLNNFKHNVKYLYKKGFYNFGIEFERHCKWNHINIKILAKQLKSLYDFYKKTNGNFKIININDAKERLSRIAQKRIWWGNCDKLILGSDGKYYICERAFSFSEKIRKKAQIGNIENGIDFKKREKLYKEAYNYITSNIADSYLYYYCPMGTYFINKWLKRDLKSGLLELLILSKTLYMEFYKFINFYDKEK